MHRNRHDTPVYIGGAYDTLKKGVKKTIDKKDKKRAEKPAKKLVDPLPELHDSSGSEEEVPDDEDESEVEASSKELRAEPVTATAIAKKSSRVKRSSASSLHVDAAFS